MRFGEADLDRAMNEVIGIMRFFAFLEDDLA
jgi:hypothetical protein